MSRRRFVQQVAGTTAGLAGFSVLGGAQPAQNAERLPISFRRMLARNAIARASNRATT